MSVKAGIASLLLALASPVFAQITANEQPIQDAFVALRNEQEILLTLDGYEKLGTRVDTLYSNAFFKWDPLTFNGAHVLAKTDINDYVNGVQTRRVTADGTTVWGYDFAKNAYTTLRYGSYSGPPPAGFRSNMLQEVTTDSRGPTLFMARMLREIYSGDVAQYSTWMPMATVTQIGKGQSMQDPIVPTRTYAGDDRNMYVVYTYATRPQRSAAFHLTRPDVLSPWSLSEILYADSLNLNTSTPRLLDWRIAVYTGALPYSTNYVFIPPSRARAIANVKGQGGG